MLLTVVFAVAAISYAASLALGVLVGTKLVDSSPFHWLHHALYSCTFVLAAGTVVVAALTAWAVAALLGPSLVAFAFIPFLGTHGARHPLIGVAPVPFYIAAGIALAVIR